jgi:uncharacterized membrane protein YdjX (TVP38/TMEM64 family)
MNENSATEASGPNASRRLAKVVGAVWLLLFGSATYLLWSLGTPLDEIPFVLSEWLKGFGVLKAAGLYILIYTVRPLILMPATLLTMAAGLIFGPTLGIILTIVGENFSANFAFWIARTLGRDWVALRTGGTIGRWEDRLRENGMITVLIMRLLFLPFDLVNFGCGLTSMRQRDYAIGTFIGILPGIIAFVLMGGAAHADTQNRWLIASIGVGAAIAGVVIARVLKAKNLHDGE